VPVVQISRHVETDQEEEEEEEVVEIGEEQMEDLQEQEEVEGEVTVPPLDPEVKMRKINELLNMIESQVNELFSYSHYLRKLMRRINKEKTTDSDK
jgi:hypothetical protein